MNILYLGPDHPKLIDYLKKCEKSVTQTTEILEDAFLEKNAFDFLISYGYRHILKKKILDRFPDRAINLHISYLPWNRGADPNFWSFKDNTPKGVTIHYLDEGVDTGDIIVQKLVAFSNQETLKTSYDKLQQEIENLFIENWPKIRSGVCARAKQQGKGSVHRKKDLEAHSHLLTHGWNTVVGEISTQRDIDLFGVR